MGIGLRIKKILRNRHMTIKELSEKSAVSLNTLYSITKRDSERVDSIILQRIALALEVPTSVLLSDHPSRKEFEQMTEEKLLMFPNSQLRDGTIFFEMLRTAGYDAFMDTTRYPLIGEITEGDSRDAKIWIVEDKTSGRVYTATTNELNKLKDDLMVHLHFQVDEFIRGLEQIERKEVAHYRGKNNNEQHEV
ncbi:MAG: helix-turn-helix transcriptional regulator [Negativibacillus massiliensis]|nr:helix-turn-helix transcriptional regulator [Negativibacillus massiliensis]